MIAGTVQEIGPGVTGFRVGDEVYGIASANGTFAEYAVVPAKKLAPKPASLTFEQAAGVPVSGSTALQAVRETVEREGASAIEAWGLESVDARDGHRVIGAGAALVDLAQASSPA